MAGVAPDPLRRGELWLTQILLPDRVGEEELIFKDKWIVLLQDSTAYVASDASFVVGSTWRGRPLGVTDVLLGESHGCEVDTVFDCRFVYTLTQKMIRDFGTLKATLDEPVMDSIAVATAIGLQLA